MESSSSTSSSTFNAPTETAPARPRPPPPTTLRPGYVCNRCGKAGHHISLCPTNGDPNYDRGGIYNGGAKGAVDASGATTATVAKIRGVPANSIQFVKDLTGVDTTGKIVRNVWTI